MNRIGITAFKTMLLFITASCFAAPSASILVDSNTRNTRWSTVFTNAVPLSWDWSGSATSARLDISGMGGTFTTNFPDGTTSYLWRAFASDVTSAEDVYTLTLTVYSNGNNVAGAFTSRLAVVTGAFGVATVNAVSNSPTWSQVKTDVVIPYDAYWSEGATNAVSTQLVIDRTGGAAQTNAFADIAGYTGWKIRNSGWGYGTFDLSLSFPGTTNVWYAGLMRPQDGTMVRVR